MSLMLMYSDVLTVDVSLCDGLLLMTHLVLMTFLSSPDENHCSDGLLDVDAKVETILLHMMSLLGDSILYLDAILHDELVYDANLDALLLANSDDTIHDVVHDPNTHDEMAHDAILLLSVLHNDDSTLLMRCPRDTPDEVVQRRCRQSHWQSPHRDKHGLKTSIWATALHKFSLLTNKQTKHADTQLNLLEKPTLPSIHLTGPNHANLQCSPTFFLN